MMSASRPNILQLFTDQQRFDTIRALGHTVMRTPNLDRLCDTGCYDNGFPFPSDGRQTLAGALTEAGYRTHAVGKCHYHSLDTLLGHQTRETQEECAFNDQLDYVKYLKSVGFGHATEPQGVRGEMYYIPQVSLLPPDHHPTQWVGNRALAFIDEQSGQESPWYLFCSFIHPHPPFSPPTPWHKIYRAPQMPLPKVPADVESLYTWVNRHQNRYKYRDQGIDQNLVRCIRAYYYATISFIDFQVGRILDALEERGELENTLVMYTSDHGELLGDYNCFGKRSFHDSASRVPLVAAWPGRLPAGVVCDRPASMIDVVPTALAAAGTTLGSHEPDGVELGALAAGEAARDEVFIQIQRADYAQYTVVSERWKYCYSAADNREFLIDRHLDPAETRNRVGTPFSTDAAAAMKRCLIGELQAAGETPAYEDDDWRRYPVREVSADPDSGLLIQDPGVDQRVPGYSDEPATG
jgi:arylsulfatase A-like enzyme